MAKYLWVKPTRDDRKVILSEADPAHPVNDNGDHEVFVAAYPDAQPTQVGDTGLVRARIASGDLVEVDAPARKSARLSDAEKERQAAEQAEADRLAAEKEAAARAAQGSK